MRRLTFLSWSKKVGAEGHRLTYSAIWIGVALAICVTLLSFTVLGIYALVTGGSIYNYASLISLVAFISVAVGGIISGNIARFQGWLHGGLVGVVYSLLLLVLAVVLVMQEINLVLLGRMLLFVLLGAGGGVLGVNLPEFRRPRAGVPSPKRRRV
ncbi:MAG TPA: TIGR04086 family membrane protein [Clostridia bacterium]|nr:TIGR04086 family membrane protein [Clostridia bacterium]